MAHAQQKMLVYFTDKGNDAITQLQHPENFLSQASIERRLICNASFDMLDVPVSKEYIAALQLNQGIVLSTSKWLNAALVSTSFDNIHTLLSLPFVAGIQVWDEYQMPLKHTASTQSVYNYGSATAQITMLNLDKIHDQGFTGNNILISVCDGGFNNVNTLGCFQYVRSNNRIKATRDFVNDDGDVYADDMHGEEVFSILAAKVDGGVIGSGFDANFLLARTENVSSETHAEEYNWVRASEWADSMGARIIQSSLGYNDFDAGINYAPSDMNGRTAIITQGAVIATRKGIVIVNSAGNEGDKPFRKITAPSDADSILCVGSVNTAQNRVSNSGQGPSADGRIKPDVMAVGGGTAYYNNTNTIAFGTGTSFASPIIAGFCACLMQKYKYVTNIELINAVKRSADRYSTPDTFYGYGIPNALIADTILANLSKGRGIYINTNSFESIIKNSIVDDGSLKLLLPVGEAIDAQIFNVSGAQVMQCKVPNSNEIQITGLSSGMYYLKINGYFAGKFIKQ